MRKMFRNKTIINFNAMLTYIVHRNYVAILAPTWHIRLGIRNFSRPTSHQLWICDQ